MKTSIFKSLLILTTLVIPLVSAPLLADEGHDDKGHHNKRCKYSIKKGNTGKECSIITAEAGEIFQAGKYQKVKTIFTLSKSTKKKHLEIYYTYNVSFNENTKACNKAATKISKKKNKFKLHHRKDRDQLEFTAEARLSKSKKARNCTVASQELSIFKIKYGNLGDVTQAGGNTPPQPDPTVSVSAGKVVEGDEGEVMLEFTVALSSAPVREMAVNFRTDPGSATKGDDFIDTTGKLEFSPQSFAQSSLTRTVQVPVVGDLIVEAEEDFTICTVTEVAGVAGPEVFTKATIIDNDVVTTVSKADQIANLRQIVYTESVVRGVGSVSEEQRKPITALDLEGDGDDDVVVIYSKPYDNAVGEVVIYRNDNTTDTGWIEEPTGIMTNGTSTSILVEDFTGNGQPDLFIYNPFGAEDLLLVQVSGGLVIGGNIPGTPWVNTYTKGYQKHMVKHSAGDIDNDGDIDVFVVSQKDPQNYNGDSHKWYINDGFGNFTLEHRTYWKEKNLNFNNVYSSAIADFNGDGVKEIFLGTNNSEYVETAPGRWTGQLLDNNNAIMTVDGVIDHVVPRVTNDNCNACTNRATSIDVKAVDINGDGWVDIITQNYDGSLDGTNSRVDVYLGNNDGTFDLSQSLTNGSAMDGRISLEDVNGDGYLDIVSLPFNQVQTYYNQSVAAQAGYTLNRTESVVFVNDGGGYFAEDASVTIDQTSILSAMHFLTADTKYIPTELLK